MSNNFGLGMAGGAYSTEAKASVRGGFTSSEMSESDVLAAAEAAEKFQAAMLAAKSANKLITSIKKDMVCESIKNYASRVKTRSNRMAICKEMVAAGIFEDTGDAMEWIARNEK